MPTIIVSDINPRAPWRVSRVEALPDYRLSVRFLDGVEGIVDMAGLVRSPRAGVFAALGDATLFRRVFVCLGAITWPGNIDIAPDRIHADIAASAERTCVF
jgi:Protein of unknown function (DUF2442)